MIKELIIDSDNVSKITLEFLTNKLSKFYNDTDLNIVCNRIFDFFSSRKKNSRIYLPYTIIGLNLDDKIIVKSTCYYCYLFNGDLVCRSRETRKFPDYDLYKHKKVDYTNMAMCMNCYEYFEGTECGNIFCDLNEDYDGW